MTLFGRRAAIPGAASYSVVDEQLVIQGEIHTQGTIRIDGRLEGRLHRADTLVVGANGTVCGDIEAREVVVAGTIEGNIIANVRVEIQPTGTILGDIRAAALMLHEGGAINGHVMVDRTVKPVEGARLELARERTPAALQR